MQICKGRQASAGRRDSRHALQKSFFASPHSDPYFGVQGRIQGILSPFLGLLDGGETPSLTPPKRADHLRPVLDTHRQPSHPGAQREYAAQLPVYAPALHNGPPRRDHTTLPRQPDQALTLGPDALPLGF